MDPQTVAELVDITNSEDEFVNSCLSLTSTSMTSTPNTRYVRMISVHYTILNEYMYVRMCNFQIRYEECIKFF